MRGWNRTSIPAAVSLLFRGSVIRFARILLECGLAVALLVLAALLTPLASAQKPPSPAPPPSQPQPPTSGQPTTPTVAPQPIQPADDFVMFLQGRVTTDDSTHLPTDVMVERVCNSQIRQQVYASSDGGFSMQLGAVTDSILDATADGSLQSAMPGKFSDTGIPRRDLANCELRASISGFQSSTISLVDLDDIGKSVQVGTIVVHRRAKIAGSTISAIPYKAPKDALAAYEKGIDAERNGKLENARQNFEKAVAIYPAYAPAWFQLGTVLQKTKQNEAARNAYTQATTSDVKFLPPYLSLARMAAEVENWKGVLGFTGHILALDPFKNVTGYTVELDPFNYGEAYFYNALANFKTDNLPDAERSALRAEHLMTRFPQVHVLLSDLFARKQDYDSAISEMQTYLELVLPGTDADLARQRLAKLQEAQRLAAKQ